MTQGGRFTVLLATALALLAATSTPTVAAPAFRAADTVKLEKYVDSSRRTPAAGRFAGSDNRTLEVEYHVPDGHGPFPVVLWSHGKGTPLGSYDVLAEQFTSRGYLFVAPSYPLLGAFSPAGPDGAEFDKVNQPADASFVLSRMIVQSEDPGHWLHGLVDTGRIGAAGESAGGFTTLGLLNSCCSDRRIRAAFVVAPAMQSGPRGTLPGQWFTSRNPPIMFMQSSGDGEVSIANTQDFYAKMQPPKYFMQTKGGNHYDVVRSSGDLRRAIEGSMVAFFDAYLKGDTSGFARLRTFGNLPGASSLRTMVRCEDRDFTWVRSPRVAC